MLLAGKPTIAAREADVTRRRRMSHCCLSNDWC
jgi:hypothetical protein